ncbi:hypothetical protein F0562_024831 [Nyssa sinensis]|uniref:AIPP2-like SPOC-like domain-containing protein n=1 Tax=Nyssa sinensis TaxID=561372 RepID=A0A5J5BFI4_9ASTE|nr:hypothetical protein F0562_024831 [Nyssa sinensis]
MPHSSETHLDKPCDICGDIGVVDAIVTCSQCIIAREHVYCMQIYRQDIPEFWLCGACKLSNEAASPKSGVKEDLPKALLSNSSGMVHRDTTHSAGHSKLGNDSGRRVYLNWEKKVDIGKVKYITAQEAIRLSSGTKKSESPSKGLYSSPGTSKIVASMSMRTPFKPKTIPLNFSSHKAKTNSGFRPSRHLKSPRHGNVQINSVLHPQVTQTSKELKGDVICTDVEPVNSDTVVGNMTNVMPIVEKSFPSHPALDASWKGSFKFIDAIKHRELNDGFKAHPKTRARRKVYEFSKQMPRVLQFKLLPRSNFWMDIFQDECPDRDDIALYFFSSDSERSENYTFLLEYIATHDLVLRSYMDGVELLVLTSKLLHLDSQKWNQKYFLWGVFRRVKKDEIISKENRELPSFVCPSYGAHDSCGNAEESEAVDMEIDMIGGKNVGKVDLVIPKESFRRSCGISGKKTTTVITFHGSGAKIPALSKKLDFNVQQPLLEGKRELWNDIPPGFEETCWLKVRDSSFGKAMNVAKDNTSLQIGSEAVGANSLQPHKSVEDSDLPGLQQKLHQVSADGQKTDATAFSSPLSVKNDRFGLAVKVENPDNERYSETEKEGIMGTPISNNDSSQGSKLTASREDNRGHLQHFPVKAMYSRGLMWREQMP